MDPVAFVNPKRIEQARLAANMSRADLVFAIRAVTQGRIKPNEESLRRWEKGRNKPSDGVIPAIASATGKPIEFFYEQGDGDEPAAADGDEEPARVSIDQALRVSIRQILREEREALLG